jgi:protease-4
MTEDATPNPAPQPEGQPAPGPAASPTAAPYAAQQAPASWTPDPRAQVPPVQDPRASYAPNPYASGPYTSGPYGSAPYATNPAAYAESRPRHSAWFYIGVIGGSAAVIFLLMTGMIWLAMRSAGGSSGSLGLGSGGNQIAVLDIDGVITDADKVNTQLRKFGDDASVKAIILHIDSPGGGAAASQEIYHEVLRIRQEKHKKIIASVESVGASGAYYIASACDKIYANEASVVGSIGVIMEWTNYGELFKWAKLKSVAIHAGALKDAGDPTRDVTPEEQVYFQSLVDNMYTQFIRDVASGRHTTDDKIKPLATGQVWTGQQSLPLGLIDKVGGFRTALMETAKDVGISGEPTIVRPAKINRGLLSALTDGEDLFPNPSQYLNQAPGFYFMWK